VVVAAYAVVRLVRDDNYYVTVDNQNRLVIYQGRPAASWGSTRSRETTDVTTATVRTDQLANLKANVEEPTLAAARQYIRNLQSAYAAQQLLLHPPRPRRFRRRCPHQRRPRKHRRAARPSSPEPRRPLRHPPRPRPQRPATTTTHRHMSDRHLAPSMEGSPRWVGASGGSASCSSSSSVWCSSSWANIQFHKAGALASDPKNRATPRSSSTTSAARFWRPTAPCSPSRFRHERSYKYQRVYPQGSLYSQLVGYDSSIYGTNGIEDQYNELTWSPTPQPAQSLAQLLSPPPKDHRRRHG